MIQDLNLRMDYQLTLNTNSASSYWIDTLVAANALNGGHLPQWRVQCITTPVSTAGTLTIQLQTSPNNLFDSNAVTLMATAAIPLSQIYAQTANIAPPGYTQAFQAGYSPALISAPLATGALQFLRTYYLFSTTASFTTGGGYTSVIVIDDDVLIGSNLQFLQK